MGRPDGLEAETRRGSGEQIEITVEARRAAEELSNAAQKSKYVFDRSRPHANALLSRIPASFAGTNQDNTHSKRSPKFSPRLRNFFARDNFFGQKKLD
jgi:hypothetical protein